MDPWLVIVTIGSIRVLGGFWKYKGLQLVQLTPIISIIYVPEGGTERVVDSWAAFLQRSIPAVTFKRQFYNAIWSRCWSGWVSSTMLIDHENLRENTHAFRWKRWSLKCGSTSNNNDLDDSWHNRSCLQLATVSFCQLQFYNTLFNFVYF